jgi:ATP-dependent helicase/nuclease subunit B
VNFEALAHLVRPLPAPATPGADPLAEAARILVADHVGALPDLTGPVVLLPSLHTVAPFARALAGAAGRPALLLPHLTTLPQLAAGVALPQPAIPDSARQSLVYAALRERGWFADTDLWAIAGELLALFDELTLHHVPLPERPAEFAARLADAYGARSSAPLQFEARLVHELWFAMHGVPGDRPDRARAYQMQLAHLAAHADRPLYAVGLAELAPSEVEFLLRYAERQPVALLRPTPLAPEHGGVPQVLATSWRATGASLPERAAELRARLPHSPLSGRLRLFPAHSLEQEARAAETQIRRWLAQGRRHIAVVAQDRLAARRVRALLERAQVLVEDETGWTLSTTAASSVIMRWLDLLAGDFFHQDLLDFLKSPLVFADWAAAERKEAVYDLEQLIRAQSIVSRLIHYRAAAHGKATRCAALLERLHEAQKLWPRRPQTLRGWLDILRGTLDALGITAALETDLAGAQLLATLATLREELGQDPVQFHFKEWRHWLDRQLETATFRDTGIASPVVFTHLPATRLRRFDGVVLLGCDAEKLPSRGNDGLFFNQSVRAQLGLPLREARTRIELEDVAALLAGCDEILVTWQRMVNGEEHLISPWFDLVQTLHQLAYRHDLVDTELAALASAARIVPAAAAPLAASTQPAPALPSPRVPDTLSASGYNSLLACPYQYYARHVLKLNDVDEVQVEMEKRDFGELVHRILLEFHRTHPMLVGGDPAALEQALRDISRRVFGPMLQLNYLSHAWALRWDALVPEYIAWQRERERAGWRWDGGETAKCIALPLPNGGTLTLRGTLDRVDRAGDRLAVLDYKTRAAGSLRAQLKTMGEDVQLPVYALLAEGAVAEACYISLDKDEVKTVPLQADLDTLARDVAQRLTDIFAALHAGAALPAQGTDEACARCEMRGLCRRDYWRRTP